MTPTFGQLNTSFDPTGCVGGVLSLMAHLTLIMVPICEHLDISVLRWSFNFNPVVTKWSCHEGAVEQAVQVSSATCLTAWLVCLGLGYNASEKCNCSSHRNTPNYLDLTAGAVLLKQWKTWLLSWLGMSSLSELYSITAILLYMREGKKRTAEETQKGHCPYYSVTSWLRYFHYFTRNTRNTVAASLLNLTRHFISSQNWFALAEVV